jgi:two-component system OmpR family sensor kinase
MTLRVRLMLGLVALLAICLAVAGTVSALALRAHLVDQTDTRLRGAQKLLSTEGAARLGQITPMTGAVGLQQALAPTDFVVELRPPDGSVLTVAGDGAQLAPETRPGVDPPASGGAGGAMLSQVDDLDGRVASGAPFTLATSRGRYRVVVGSLPGGLTDLIALPLRPVRDATSRLILIELVAGAAVLGLGGGCAWLLLGRGLRPLRDITRTAVAIADGDLARRVPHGPPRTETDQLAAALNVMLTQIQTAFEESSRSQDRLRRFVADASHELRTPLTSVRGYVDLLRLGVVPPAGTDDALRRVQHETRRMGSLVDDLLYLAHLDEERPLERRTVDLAAIVRDAVADAAVVEPDRPWAVHGPPECPLPGDPDALRQVVGNLVANVRVHTPAGTPAEVSLAVCDDRVRLEVRDEGPGVESADLERIFDRFYRSSAGRDRGRGGSGLGMSIVAAVAAAHRGSTEATSAPGQGLTVRVTLPGR